MTKRWVRYQLEGEQGFGLLSRETIQCFIGDMFGTPKASGVSLASENVRLLPPCKPTKIIAIWNNFHHRAAVEELTLPQFPFYCIKPSSCVIGDGEEILHPDTYDGRLLYEGELGVVIGKTCKSIAREAVSQHIFGYTCLNDVTAIDLLFKYEAFPQWTRSKGFDSFGVIGPCITELESPDDLVIRTEVNGVEHQNYPVSDMIFSPLDLVSLISGDMTLYPGDVIACGTSLGVKTMKPDTTVCIDIPGVGQLTNYYQGAK
ncbi:MAG: 2-hydroxyhepta-2,4-diene-1,7-dioate isomerase [Gammaproteobacteria bacterium]|nr:MAG: 2-hydroxyhepta-2,4-diene-1,7-dioate isomerase [Gammaproteobacteria bacterium]